MRIYLAGPLSAPTPEGRQVYCRRAIEVAVRLMIRGHQPFCPHLSEQMNRVAAEMGLAISYEEWMMYDREWLRFCDALLYLGSSPGADRELAWAQTMGVKIFMSEHDVPDGA